MSNQDRNLGHSKGFANFFLACEHLFQWEFLISGINWCSCRVFAALYSDFCLDNNGLDMLLALDNSQLFSVWSLVPPISLGDMQIAPGGEHTFLKFAWFEKGQYTQACSEMFADIHFSLMFNTIHLVSVVLSCSHLFWTCTIWTNTWIK